MFCNQEAVVRRSEEWEEIGLNIFTMMLQILSHKYVLANISVHVPRTCCITIVVRTAGMPCSGAWRMCLFIRWWFLHAGNTDHSTCLAEHSIQSNVDVVLDSYILLSSSTQYTGCLLAVRGLLDGTGDW